MILIDLVAHDTVATTHERGKGIADREGHDRRHVEPGLSVGQQIGQEDRQRVVLGATALAAHAVQAAQPTGRCRKGEHRGHRQRHGEDDPHGVDDEGQQQARQTTTEMHELAGPFRRRGAEPAPQLRRNQQADENATDGCGAAQVVDPVRHATCSSTNAL